MDGNGRWALSRGLPRAAGHSAGVAALRRLISGCLELDGVDTLTVFAFSSENWRRPPAEVSALLSLIDWSVQGELDDLLQKGVQLRFIGMHLHSAYGIYLAIDPSIYCTYNVVYYV